MHRNNLLISMQDAGNDRSRGEDNARKAADKESRLKPGRDEGMHHAKSLDSVKSGTARKQENQSLDSSSDFDNPDIISSHSDDTGTNLEDLRKEELFGSPDESIRSMNYSDTDEDEDEGLGDGNLGRSRESLD